MSAAVGCPSLSRAVRCVALFLVPVLAGCATASGGRTSSAWRQEAPRYGSPGSVAPPGVLLAMSDGSPEGGALAGPGLQGYNAPGRKPDSQMPWGFYMGNASHRLIAYVYGVNHPDSIVYYNTRSIKSIVGAMEV